MSSTQVAVRCNDQLLRDLDWLVIRCDYENRAEAIRAALQQVIDAERRREIGEQIAEGYRRIPQTDDEFVKSDLAHMDAEEGSFDWSDWV
ncbi:MAG TPA: hypothetical protein VNQ73_12600 [Ilumatobacter sp.]|nr:hypothetical protein [Ilumatobacter sp.]